MNNSSSSSISKEEVARDTTTLLDLVFSWSIKDVLNKNLFKGKVKQIPDKYSSVADYMNSFKNPLIEETRADYSCGLESVGQAPSCEISRVTTSKFYKPPKNLSYDIFTKPITDLENHGGHYEPESGDLLVLTKVRPTKLEDVIIKPGEPFMVAKVEVSNDEQPMIQILLSQEFDPELWGNKRERIFATYLMNLTTNLRIWRALSVDPKGANMGLILKVLKYDAAVDDDCSLCLCQGSVNVKEWESFKLDESQKNAVLSCISMRKCPHQKHNVKLIWGPPGTGKTKTVASLLYLLLKLKCRTLTCTPTNIAVLQVAERLVRLFLQHSHEYGTYGLGDIVLFGNKKRMKIDDHDELVDVFLEYRCDILTDCLSLTGWKYTLQKMMSLLEDPEGKYNDYLRKNNGNHKDKNVSKKLSNGKSTISSKDVEGSKKNKGKHSKKVINQSLIENKKKDGEKGKKKVDDPPVKIETEELMMTYDEFVRKNFYSLADRLGFCAKNLYTHLPTSLLSLKVAKKMIRLVNLLKSLEKARKRVGEFPELRMKREEIVKILNLLNERFPGINSEDTMWNMCLSNATLIFCTASSSMKVRSSVEMVVIDEAAQLKECESAIPLQINGLANVVLIGDDRQLPAMVRSQASEDANFGRSLFQRLASLGKKKHLLNIQYRMHPSISSFPNKEFYENKIVDAPNVKQRSYNKSFLEGDMYGSYSFINVSKGKENFDKGHSPRNLEEAAMVDRIIAKLYKGHCIMKQKMSVGVISPYKGQVGLIQERLGKKYDNCKHNGFSVSVRSVDGFQGGEEDIIIISTVRCNRNGSVGFLSNHQRTNVALTRARYCLWIVGSGTTLANSGTVWKDLVIDAKARGCFYGADDSMDLHQAIVSQPYGKLTSDSVQLGKPRWKVLFSDDFNISISIIKKDKLLKQVMEMLEKLAYGRHQPNSPKTMDVSIHGVASELLQWCKVNEQLYLFWTIDILMEESKYTQVIKVWDILPAYKIPKLVMELNVLFGSYKLDFITRCKDKSFEGKLVVPRSWPLNSVFSNLVMANTAECLSSRLAAINLRDNQGESSSSLSNMKSKQKIGSGMSWWIAKERVK